MLRFTPCLRCGHSVPLVIEDPNVVAVCEMCGEKMRVNPFMPYAVPDDIQLESDEEARAKDPWADASRSPSGRYIAVDCPSITPLPNTVQAVPAARPVAPKDPDKALTSFVLGIFRFRGWPCHELEGYRAFEVRSGFKNPATGQLDVCNVKVSAMRGVLTLETQILPTPHPQLWRILREALNEMNLRSGGSVFLFTECGVLARNKIIPRPAENGTFSERGVLQGMRQLNHDRRLALPLLHAVLGTGKLKAEVVAQAFAKPAAPNTIAPMPIEQVGDLAEFAGYCAHRIGETLYLSEGPCAPEECPLRLLASTGVLRTWTILQLEATRGARPKWSFVKKVIKSVRTHGLHDLSVLGRLLEQLNVLNEGAGHLRFVWHEGSVLAMSVYTPVESELTVEEFKAMLDALMKIGDEKSQEHQEFMTAV